MAQGDLFEDIISNIDPDDVPLEFIVLAKVTDFNGEERIIRGHELAEALRGPNRSRLMEARVILDVRKIRRAIIDEVNLIYDEINRRIAADIGGTAE